MLSVKLKFEGIKPALLIQIKYLSINGEEILSRSPQVYARHIKPPAFYEDPTRYFFNLIIFISIFILPIALYYSYHGYRNRKKIDKIFASRLEQKESIMQRMLVQRESSF